MPQRCLHKYACIIILTGLGEAMKFPQYEFVLDESGWLRLHILPATWADARVRCNAEGDILASPTTQIISTKMKDIMTRKGTVTGVFVDIHTTLTERAFISIDGTPISNIFLKWAEGEPTNSNGNEECLQMTAAGELADVSCTSVLPFFCLKPMGSTAAQTVVCDTEAEGYKYESRTGSCYKFHKEALAWFPAYMACSAEFAHLAVINSDAEAQILKELYKMYPDKTITTPHYAHYAHIGFWDWSEKSQWVTIFGETMENAGYNEWAPNEPNNPGEEICGSITRDGKLNDGYCITHLPYICESGLTTKAPETMKNQTKF